MNSITMNFDDNTDINAVYNQLKKLYPDVEIIRNTLDEILEDEYLLALALEREKNDDGTRYSHEEIMAEFGITREALDRVGDIEIE